MAENSAFDDRASVQTQFDEEEWPMLDRRPLRVMRQAADEAGSAENCLKEKNWSNRPRYLAMDFIIWKPNGSETCEIYIVNCPTPEEFNLVNRRFRLFQPSCFYPCLYSLPSSRRTHPLV